MVDWIGMPSIFFCFMYQLNSFVFNTSAIYNYTLCILSVFSQEISQKELMSNYLLDRYLIPNIGYECPFIEDITTRITNSVNSKLKSSGGFDWNAKESFLNTDLSVFFFCFMYQLIS
jgi:hypothetical protein